MEKLTERRLEDILHEAETSEDTEECIPCRIAAGIGITKNLCQEFKNELDCRELIAMIENPELYTLEEVEQAVQKIAECAQGKPRELLTYTLCLMKGECSVENGEKRKTYLRSR